VEAQAEHGQNYITCSYVPQVIIPVVFSAIWGPLRKKFWEALSQEFAVCYVWRLRDLFFAFRGKCWAAIRLSHRPEPSGRAVHREVDGLDIRGRHGRRFVLLRHTHRQRWPESLFQTPTFQTPKFFNPDPGPAIIQIWESDSCSDSGYNHRSNRNLPMVLLKKWPKEKVRKSSSVSTRW